MNRSLAQVSLRAGKNAGKKQKVGKELTIDKQLSKTRQAKNRYSNLLGKRHLRSGAWNAHAESLGCVWPRLGRFLASSLRGKCR